MYGVLISSTNTGVDSELRYVFAAPLSITSNQPVYSADTMNLGNVTSTQGSQRWEIETGIASTNNSANFLVHSVMAGYDSTFKIRMPQVYIGTKRTSVPSKTVFAGVAASNDTFDITETIVPLLVGEFIKFAGHDKVYLVTDAGAIVGANRIGVKITPKLRAAIIPTEVISYDDRVNLTAFFSPDTALGIKYVDGILTDQGAVKFIEKV